MPETTSYTWTEHTFRCSTCFRLCRASQEAIKETREYTWVEEGATDAQIASDYEFCLSCIEGRDVAGERVPMRVKLIAVDQTTNEETVQSEDCDLRECFPDSPDDVNDAAYELGRRGQTFVGGGAAQLYRLVRISG